MKNKTPSFWQFLLVLMGMPFACSFVIVLAVTMIATDSRNFSELHRNMVSKPKSEAVAEFVVVFLKTPTLEDEVVRLQLAEQRQLASR